MGTMRESYLEASLRRAVEKRGGRFYKWVSPGNAGVPDRIAFMPGGRIAFVELKTESGRVRSLQKFQKKLLESFGFEVYTVFGKKDAADFIAALDQEGGDAR